MKLSIDTSYAATGKDLVRPTPSLFELPEKVLQFGTGVLLRALPDYFIDKANRQGIFGGRVVVVKSTDAGDPSQFSRQDHLYTICVRGIEDGEMIAENIICSAISRVLTAASQWQQLLECVHQSSLRIVISNTTEVGIQLVRESIFQHPPVSFPGKLLALLYERYIFFKGDHDAGMIIIPTELITGNGDKLAAILNELATFNGLDTLFIHWLNAANHFCNSLVDRIVPGKPPASMQQELVSQLGYDDDLAIICEVYRLWAIQGDDKIKAALSFADCDDGVIITDDIELFRELKIRLLNGTHTLSCGLAHLAGFTTVVEAMENQAFYHYAEQLMLDEIAAAIPVVVPAGAALQFGKQVLERFRNPYIRHPWLNIALQYSSKLKFRVVPVLTRYYEVFRRPPARIALGFAAHFLFMKTRKDEQGNFQGNWTQANYKVVDDQAGWYCESWQNKTDAELASLALRNIDFWGVDLAALPGFENEVVRMMGGIRSEGVLKLISEIQ